MPKVPGVNKTVILSALSSQELEDFYVILIPHCGFPELFVVWSM